MKNIKKINKKLNYSKKNKKANVEICKILLLNGANSLLKNKKNLIPLEIAKEQRNKLIIRILSEKKVCKCVKLKKPSNKLKKSYFHICLFFLISISLCFLIFFIQISELCKAWLSIAYISFFGIIYVIFNFLVFLNPGKVIAKDEMTLLVFLIFTRELFEKEYRSKDICPTCKVFFKKIKS